MTHLKIRTPKFETTTWATKISLAEQKSSSYVSINDSRQKYREPSYKSVQWKIYAQSSDQAISRQVAKLVLHKLSFYKLKAATELNFMH